jgi:ABC-2 type transport system ATP-binding protein
LVLGDERNFYWRLTGRENLEFFASLYGVTAQEARNRINFLSSLLNLENELDRRFLSYSAGARQKLAIIRALIPGPKILLMDEPFKNLDQATIKIVQEYIKKDVIPVFGTTVLYTTHSRHEVDEFSTLLIEIHKGVIQEGKP